jgi:hypothetical protein
MEVVDYFSVGISEQWHGLSDATVADQIPQQSRFFLGDR